MLCHLLPKFDWVANEFPRSSYVPIKCYPVKDCFGQSRFFFLFDDHRD